MKILLIQPPSSKRNIGAGIFYLNEPLALETVGASVLNHNVEIFDMRLENGIEKKLSQFNPDIVGITAYTQEVYIANSILQQIKKYNNNIFTVVGGQHSTLFPQDFHKKFVDVIVIGDGCETFPELVQVYEKRGDIKQVRSIAIPENGKLTFTSLRPLANNLDKLPIPARNLTDKYRNNYFRLPWKPVATMMSSRGCPFRCNFCSVWKHQDGKYRIRSPQKVVEEIISIKEQHISIADDNFLHDYNRALEIYKLVKEKGIKKKYKIVGRSDSVVRHPDIIEKYKEIGLNMIVLGLESFRDEELKGMNKSNLVESNNKAIKIIHSYGVTIVAQFIIDPQYTKDDFDALFSYIEEMKLTHPLFTVLTPLPGTDLYEETKHKLLTDNYELFDLIHCVLPTKLPREQFYQYYADLLRKCYESKIQNIKEEIISEETLQKFYRSIIEAYKL